MNNSIIKRIDPSQIRYEPAEGEVIQTPAGDIMMYHDGAWNTIHMEGSGIELGLYDLNKQIIAQLPDFTDWDSVPDLI